MQPDDYFQQDKNLLRDCTPLQRELLSRRKMYNANGHFNLQFTDTILKKIFGPKKD